MYVQGIYVDINFKFLESLDDLSSLGDLRNIATNEVIYKEPKEFVLVVWNEEISCFKKFAKSESPERGYYFSVKF